MSTHRPPMMGVALVIATSTCLAVIAAALLGVGHHVGLALVLLAFAIVLLTSSAVTMMRRTR
jgi:hypothetical protein